MFGLNICKPNKAMPSAHQCLASGLRCANADFTGQSEGSEGLVTMHTSFAHRVPVLLYRLPALITRCSLTTALSTSDVAAHACFFRQSRIYDFATSA